MDDYKLAIKVSGSVAFLHLCSGDGNLSIRKEILIEEEGKKFRSSEKIHNEKKNSGKLFTLYVSFVTYLLYR